MIGCESALRLRSLSVGAPRLGTSLANCLSLRSTVGLSSKIGWTSTVSCCELSEIIELFKDLFNV